MPDRPSALTADQLAEDLDASLMILSTGGTIVCASCNASDVTDDDHRPGCPIFSARERAAELVRRASERDQAVRERDEALHAEDVAERYREQAVERIDRLAAALESAKLSHAALSMATDDGDDYGDHVGLQRHRRAVYLGQAEILSRWEEAFQPYVEPSPLPEGRLLPHKRAVSQETPE